LLPPCSYSNQVAQRGNAPRPIGPRLVVPTHCFCRNEGFVFKIAGTAVGTSLDRAWRSPSGCFGPNPCSRDPDVLVTLQAIPYWSRLGRNGMRSRSDLAMLPKILGAWWPALVSAPFCPTRRGVVWFGSETWGSASRVYSLIWIIAPCFTSLPTAPRAGTYYPSPSSPTGGGRGQLVAGST